MREEGSLRAGTLEGLVARLDALSRIAVELAVIRAQARRQATRMRLRALREAAELSERVTEAARDPGLASERLLDSIGEAIARIGVEDELEVTEADVGEGARVRRSDADLFDGTVEIEVGPFDDFSQLVGFEDAAGAITATSEISVKRFAGGRATLEMRLAEPTELLHELEDRAPFDFRVRRRRFDRLVLDVGGEAEETAEAA